jgi:hypothetical protein
MRSQVRPPTRWLLYCDDRYSPAWFRQRLEGISESWIEPVWVNHLDQEDLNTSVYARSTGSDNIITTRLDNDDAVARNFCERIQEEYRGVREAINFPSGAQYVQGAVYSRLDPSNAFISLVAPRSKNGPTVFATRHDRLIDVAPVRQVRDHAMWMQVVHGLNINQPVVGFRVRSEKIMQHFELQVQLDDRGILLDGIRSRASIAGKVLGNPSKLRQILKIFGG